MLQMRYLASLVRWSNLTEASSPTNNVISIEAALKVAMLCEYQAQRLVCEQAQDGHNYCMNNMSASRIKRHPGANYNEPLPATVLNSRHCPQPVCRCCGWSAAVVSFRCSNVSECFFCSEHPNGMSAPESDAKTAQK
jgi:hypothetical protein